MCINWSKLTSILLRYTKWYNNADYWQLSDRIYGNISVFANKYNLRQILFTWYKNISGEVKSLKNLKKLYYLQIDRGQITGSKTDLYNQGANLGYFSI